MPSPLKNLTMIESARSIAYTMQAKAYAMGRRSSLARSIVARLRRLRSSALKPPDFIADELGALVKFLQTAGCTFHSCTALGADPKPFGISFRYDIHLRDIAACHAFVDFHRSRRIPASFFLLWDYSDLERSYIGKFRELAGKITKPLELGLHDSPVDTHLMQSKFNCDRGAYWTWLNSPRFTEWLLALAKNEERLTEFNDAVLESLVSRVARTRELFGPISTVACHGGDMLQGLRDRLGQLEPDIDRIARSLFAKEWLAPARVRAAGLEASVDDFGRSGADWRQVSDTGGAICRMVQTLQDLSLKRKMAVQILLHPYTWDGAKRDAELSRLLQGAAGGVFIPAPVLTESANSATAGITLHSLHAENAVFLYAPPAAVGCGEACNRHFTRWQDWFEARFKTAAMEIDGSSCLVSDPDAAMLVIPETLDAYDSSLMDRKARNKVRKAEKNGYRFCETDLSDFLEDIHEINTSSDVRQGLPMPERYRNKPNYPPIDRRKYCENHAIRDFGIFRDQRLVAYCRVHIVGEFAVFGTILGHFGHLKFGIMDLLVREIVRAFLAEGRKVRGINYLHMRSTTEGLTAFKESVGFRPRRTVWLAARRSDGASEFSSVPQPSVRSSGAGRNRFAELIQSKAINKVIMRGDCCSWRAVLKNPQLFGVNKNRIVRDQKAPTIVYLDHLKGISYPDDLLLSHSDPGEMDPSLRRYYEGQNKCETLHATGADLLVMDSYADAMFQLYRHRKLGAKLWVNPRFLKDRGAFESTHVRLPKRSFDECLEDVIAYIAHIRTNNPGIPVLYLSQPVHFYPPLYPRREFCLLGGELERRVPDVYWGGHLAPDQLVPDDLGSCGPGNTLHFMPETYARMVRNAMGIDAELASPSRPPKVHERPQNTPAPDIVIG